MPSAMAPLETSTTLAAARARARRSAGPARDRRRVEAAALVGDEERADLDDEQRVVARSSRCGVVIGASAQLRRAAIALVDARPASQPSPRAAPRSRTHGPSSAALARTLATRSSRSSSGTRSILLNTSQRGLRASAGSYFFSSATIARASPTGSASVERREVDEVQQQPRALQVAQELVAEAGAFGGALDQAGDVGDDEARSAPTRTTPRFGCERGERIVGDLRPRARDGADQRRLAGVRQAEQADVGEHAQLEREACGSRPARRASTGAARG